MNINSDVLRLCDTSANLVTSMREKQFGFATDTHKILAKAPGGTFYYLVAEEEDATYANITVNGWAGYDADNSITFDGTTMQLKVIGSKILDYAASTIYINSSLSDHDTYMYGTSATPVITLDAGNNRVGFGITTPAAKTHVHKSTGGNTSGLAVSSTNGMINIWGGASDGVVMDVTNGTINGATGTSLLIRQGGTNTIAITADRDVGIGTTAPDEILHVVGDIKGSADFHLSGTGSIYFGDESTDGSGRQRYDNTTQTFYLESRASGAWGV